MTSRPSFYPTLPSVSPPQPKVSTPKDAKPAHQWTEASATVSEADVKADRDDISEELHSERVEREIAAFGETGWKKASWAD